MAVTGAAFTVLCAACLLAMGLFAWQRRTVSGAWPFALFNFALAAFLAASALCWWRGTPPDIAAVLMQARAVLGAAAPVPLLLFVLESVRREALARRLRWLVAAWPLLHGVLMLAAIATSGAPELIRADPLLDSGSGHPRLDRLNASVSMLVVAAALLLLGHALRQRGRERSRAIWLLFAMLTGAVGPIVDSVVLHASTGLVTPAALMLECALFGYAIHRFGVLGALPVAYAQVFRDFEAGIVLTDPRGRVLVANSTAVQWLGLPRGAIRGRPLAQLGEAATRIASVPPGVRAAAFAWLFEGQQNAFEVTCVAASSPFRLATGRLYLLANVTARRRAEQFVEQSTRELDRQVAEQTDELARMTANLAEGNRELARTTRLLAEAQRLARIGSWTWRRDGVGIRGSPELQMLLGRDRIVADFGLEEFVACLHPDDVAQVRSAAAELGTSTRRDGLLVRAPRPDGTLRWLRLHASRVLERDAEGRPMLALGTAQDVSEAIELEQRLGRRGEELEQRVQARSAELLALSRDQDDVNRLAVDALAPALERIETLVAQLHAREQALPTELDASLRRIGAAVTRMRAVAVEARTLADAAASQLRNS